MVVLLRHAGASLARDSLMSMCRKSAKRFSGQDMLQTFDLARFLIARTIPFERETRSKLLEPITFSGFGRFRLKQRDLDGGREPAELQALLGERRLEAG
ncbi:hypothetical protein DSM21852_32560 [Methylocystis bryophila]|nr:hypothetical protein DSM21852_32560 [Methylocystis bryophila]